MGSVLPKPRHVCHPRGKDPLTRLQASLLEMYVGRSGEWRHKMKRRDMTGGESRISTTSFPWSLFFPPKASEKRWCFWREEERPWERGWDFHWFRSIRSHFSRIECNSSPRKLAEIALNQRNAYTNSKVEHVSSIVYCNAVEWSNNTSEISAAWIC